MTMVQDEVPPPTGRKPRPPRYGVLGRAIASRVRYLQEASNNDNANAVARLAQLRRGVGATPGQVVETWEDTIGVVPDELLGRGDVPNPSEMAAHHAMTLFALHRRGKAATAHITGLPLGEALRVLSRRRAVGDGDEAEGVRRRFDALVTASTPAEGASHLRGLVLMLRDEDIGLDYGLLAEDLAWLWTPGRADAVRLRWARQYRTVRNADETPSANSDPNHPEESL